MSSPPIQELFRTPARFLRSAHLEQDFEAPGTLDGYILTETTRHAIGRVAGGLSSRSPNRAWRVTSDYGTGKSSFGLALARLFEGKSCNGSTTLTDAVDYQGLGVAPPRMLPVLVTGDREGLATALTRALKGALKRSGLWDHAQLEAILPRLTNGTPSDSELVGTLVDVSRIVVKAGAATGLLLVVDELGKFLEYAAMRPDSEDIYVLQKLAEAAVRSGEHPFVVVGMLHQSVYAYSRQLPDAVRREWEKVAGRFEELLFDQPLEQTAILVEGALALDLDRLPAEVGKAAAKAMDGTLRLNWFGPAADRTALKSRAAALYPLHPTVLPVLVRFLARFGQHQRSLFGFLLSSEPFGLQAFASSRPAQDRKWYRLHHLYDYVRSSFGHLLAGWSYRSQWVRISEIVNGCRDEEALELEVLKTVALLNLLDADDLLATEGTVHLALGASRPKARAAVEELRSRGRLHDRGAAGGYCLWPSTSVSLDRATAEARQALGSAERLAPLVAELSVSSPLIAGRHYIRTGTMRHFEVRYCDVDSLDSELEKPPRSDGLILVALCDAVEELGRATKFARAKRMQDRPETLLAVTRPLGALAGAIEDYRCWRWVARNTPELNHDLYAAAEVERHLRQSGRALASRLKRAVGLDPSANAQLSWFHLGREQQVRDRRMLLAYLSRACDKLYAKAPRIHNELVNRHQLSSAAMKARTRLIELILEAGGEPQLGLDPRTTPPEKSMYLSVLQAGGVHREEGGVLAIREPRAGHDPRHLLPALRHFGEVLDDADGSRVRVDELLASLRRPPFGVRAGLAPLLLALFSAIHQHQLAFYEDGSFIPRLSGAESMRMLKAPASFEIQKCVVEGVRAELLARLLSLLGLTTEGDREPQLLDVVTHLCVFAADLPFFARKTERLSKPARAVRKALLSAREPATLLFDTLPEACGARPFVAAKGSDPEKVRTFGSALRSALDELRACYPSLLERIRETLAAALGAAGGLDKMQHKLADRAGTVLINVREPRLKAFCLRLADRKLRPTEWLESVAGLVCSKPPRQWLDIDEANFADEVDRLAERFDAVESLVFTQGTAGDSGRSALRVAVTRPDGEVVGRVVHVEPGEATEVSALERRIEEVLAGAETRVGLVAAARVFWKSLEKDEE